MKIPNSNNFSKEIKAQKTVKTVAQHGSARTPLNFISAMESM